MTTITSLSDGLYDKLIKLLQEVKLVHGPIGLDRTLKRHPKIEKFLTEKQKQYILDLESNSLD